MSWDLGECPGQETTESLLSVSWELHLDKKIDMPLIPLEVLYLPEGRDRRGYMKQKRFGIKVAFLPGILTSKPLINHMAS